jgi:hypothetical protein
MTTKVLYFDDEIYRPGRDARKIQELLHLPDQFECELQPPPQNFSALPTELPDRKYWHGKLLFLKKVLMWMILS